MRFIRAFKVAVKNALKFHPRYALLARKSAGLPSITDPIYSKDIFIITSCVYTELNSSFINHNIKHTPAKRFSETITGLKSIKEYYPEAVVIFLESSKLSPTDRSLIDPLIDRFYDYSGSKEIKIARQHYNKGVPQYTAFVKFFEENHNAYEADTFHFLGARYILTGAIANQYKGQGSYFLFFPNHDNVSTRYFFVKGYNLKSIISAFRSTLYFAIMGNSVEDIIHGFIPSFQKVQKLEVKGIINGQEAINE